jgi:hypothetical protein
VRFARRTFQAVGAVAATGAMLSACSGSGAGDGKDRNDAPVGWSTCNALFGSDNIDALQDEMGEGTLQTLNSSSPVDELMSSLTRLARSWEPSKTAHIVNHPCDLGVEGTGERFNSYVSWSLLRPKTIESEDGWESAGNGLYVLREENGLHLTAVFPCKIEGSRKDQESELPLEVETEVRNVPGFDTKLLSRMTAQLARKVADRLPCTNDPDIPHELAMG